MQVPLIGQKLKTCAKKKILKSTRLNTFGESVENSRSKETHFRNPRIIADKVIYKEKRAAKRTEKDKKKLF